MRFLPQTDGSLLGLDDFIAPGEGTILPGGGSTRLTDVLDIKTISITDGSVSYEPPGRPPMVLTPLTFDLNRKTAQTCDPGWYAFEVEATLDPVVELHADARLNLNNGDLDLQPLTVHTRLEAAQYTVFTPSIQEVLRRFQIVGTLDAGLTGLVGLGDISRSDFGFDVHLADARAVFGDNEIPVETFDLTARYGPEGLSGAGRVSVRNARLPIVSAFQNVLKINKTHGATDRADGAFELYGDRVRFTDFNIVGRWVAIKGKGNVFFDNRLDLRVNAGPIEKLNQVLGPVGDVLGAVTRLAIVYQVTGTLDDPQVTLRPLGIGAKSPKP